MKRRRALLPVFFTELLQRRVESVTENTINCGILNDRVDYQVERNQDLNYATMVKE